jgi:prophage DNA circulation protein
MAARVGHFEDDPRPRAARRRRRREERRGAQRDDPRQDRRTWRDRLRPASFRGVPFYVAEAAGQYGRRYQHHEYPQRDVPWAEDLGRSQRRWELTGYVLGAHYMGTRDRLLTACETSGPGRLVHPYLGELQVVCDSVRYRERNEEGGMCRFEISFVEPGTQGAPDARRAAGAAIRGAVRGLASDAIAAFAGNTFRVAGFQDFVARAAAADLAQLARILDNLRGPTLQVPDAVAIEARRRILALAALTPDSVSAAQIAALVLDAVDAFASSVDVAVAFDGLDLLSQVTFAGPRTTTTTPARLQEAENAQSLTALTHQAAAAALAGPVATIPLTSYEDLVAVRTRVVTLCDRVEVDATDAVYEALAEVRAQAIAELAVRGGTLRPLRPYVTAAPRPSLTLAQRLYRDPARADALVARTGAPHPGFLPDNGLVEAA